MAMVFDLWIAGQETTSNTLAWGVLYLMQEPEVQSQMQKELDTVIGSDRLITMDDRPKLNYIAAVVNVNIISSKPPNMKRKAGTTVSPQPFVCNMSKRY
uniref:Cytochrome P450 n=1 Tax=Acrobeloides nanus TaxID=290746 RepID=A0A914EAK5_9BILA